jgi:hypothetical protein
MKYVISIFFPFVGFFLIKKPVSGYFALILNIIILLGNSLYPTPIILFIFWLVLILWAFLEINEYNTKKLINKVNKDLEKVNKTVSSVRNSQKKDAKKSKKIKTISARRNPEIEEFLLENKNTQPKQLSHDSSYSSDSQEKHNMGFDEEFERPTRKKFSDYSSNLDNLKVQSRKNFK